ncbi:MAG: methionyl-tRNA formyltransferase [Deltaproteobacteria bacterium]|jgi:methionyl-tRNA formyltransferase|nr:methionyl-tRNA formyltransferase [Deltaproteobacteria bacterium]
MKELWRLVFFGSGPVALPALAALMGGPDQVTLVVTTPPAPAGRGRLLRPTVVAEQTRAAGVPLMETSKINSPEAVAAIESLKPDLIVVSAFRGILGPNLLALGQHPPINVHPSLLPKHRGPAPVNWTILHGDDKAGVSIISMVSKIDAGPVLAQAERALIPGQGAGELETYLAHDGAKLLIQVIEDLKNKTVNPLPQNPDLVTHGRRLTKADGLMDLSKPAAKLINEINGLDPWPGARVTFKDKPLRLFGALTQPGEPNPGQIIGLDGGRLLIGTGQDVLSVAQCQPEGRNRMTGSDFFHGYRPTVLKWFPTEPSRDF